MKGDVDVDHKPKAPKVNKSKGKGDVDVKGLKTKGDAYGG